MRREKGLRTSLSFGAPPPPQTLVEEFNCTTSQVRNCNTRPRRPRRARREDRRTRSAGKQPLRAGYHITKMDELRWRAKLSRLDLQRNCSALASEDSCWLCENLRGWNDVLGALRLSLIEDKQGNLCLRSPPGKASTFVNKKKALLYRVAAKKTSPHPGTGLLQRGPPVEPSPTLLPCLRQTCIISPSVG